MSHGFRWAICSPNTHRRGAGALGGADNLPHLPPTRGQLHLGEKTSRRASAGRGGGAAPNRGSGWGGWGVSPITGRSPCTGSFLPLETRFFWSKGALGCHWSQGDPADREGGGCGGGHTGVSLPAPPARAPDWPTLSRLNIGLAEGPAPHPHWWSLMLGAPFIECPVCAKHPNNPESRMILSSHTDGCAGSEGSSK